MNDTTSRAAAQPPPDSNSAPTSIAPSRPASDPSLLAEPGIRFAVANAALVLALFATALARASLVATTTVTAIVATLAAAGLTLRWRLPIALVAWALLTGFVVNKYGELTFRDPDLTRLMFFSIAVPALATLIPTGSTPQTRPHHREPRSASRVA